MVVPVIHMKGAGAGGAIANSSGAFFFIRTLPPAGRYRALLRHPLGARTVGAFAMADCHAAQTRCPCMKRQVRVTVDNSHSPLHNQSSLTDALNWTCEHHTFTKPCRNLALTFTHNAQKFTQYESPPRDFRSPLPGDGQRDKGRNFSGLQSKIRRCCRLKVVEKG